MSTIKRNEWIFGCVDDSKSVKEKWNKVNILKLLNNSIRMFKYNNLPDTIKQKDLEIILQCNGYAIWKKVNDDLYVFYGGLGGEPNPYYLPTIAIIANPALKYNESLEIDKECVVMLNDYFYQGMMPTFSKYASLLTEAELSLKQAIINARIPAIATADNDGAYESAEAFFEKVVKGEDYGAVLTKGLLDGLKTVDFSKKAVIKETIEAVQYIKGSAFSEIGLNAAFNMKREAINTAESTLNEDILFPTIDAMLQLRKDGLEKVNKMYGTNITVEFDGTWARNLIMAELDVDMKEAEVDVVEDETDTTDNLEVDNEETN